MFLLIFPGAEKNLLHSATQLPFLVDIKRLVRGSALALFTLRMATKKKLGPVSYQENCGGMLRKLASGFRATVMSIDDCELYQELKERIFRTESTPAEKKQNLSA